MEVNVTNLFKKLGIGTRVVIEVNENMYTVKENAEENWLYFSIAAFGMLKDQLIKEKINPKTLAVIGTGNGVDAIGALHQLDTIDTLLLTDIDGRVLNLSEQNIRRNTEKTPQIYTLEGSLCEPLAPLGIMSDVIYANLPNIPSQEDVTGGIKQSSFYIANVKQAVSRVYKDHLLELQILFLRSAREYLKQGGSVVPIIGGRVPHELFGQFFRDEGYTMSEICSGFKLQTEPEEVIPGYAKAEKKAGVEFDFYLFNESQNRLKKEGIPNPTRISGAELKVVLMPYRLNATEAMRLYMKVPIGQTCHVFRGVPKNG